MAKQRDEVSQGGVAISLCDDVQETVGRPGDQHPDNQNGNGHRPGGCHGINIMIEDSVMSCRIYQGRSISEYKLSSSLKHERAA
jgi:hypothetical protein